MGRIGEVWGVRGGGGDQVTRGEGVGEAGDNSLGFSGQLFQYFFSSFLCDSDKGANFVRTIHNFFSTHDYLGIVF